MCTVHDAEPELARLPRLRKRQIKGLLGPALGMAAGRPVICVKSRPGITARGAYCRLSHLRESPASVSRKEKPRRSGAKVICGRRVFRLPQRNNSERGAGSKKKSPAERR